MLSLYLNWQHNWISEYKNIRSHYFPQNFFRIYFLSTTMSVNVKIWDPNSCCLPQWLPSKAFYLFLKFIILKIIYSCIHIYVYIYTHILYTHTHTYKISNYFPEAKSSGTDVSFCFVDKNVLIWKEIFFEFIYYITFYVMFGLFQVF